jgi:hypothetical protein
MVNTTNTDVASQISNKKYTVLTSTWYNGDWINMADTNQRNNMQEVLNGVGQQVKQAQVEIKTATNQASDAMSSASVAIESSKVNSQAILDVNSATSEVKSDAATAFDQAKSAMSAAISNSSAISTLDSSVSISLSSANDRINEAKSAISANQAAITSAQSVANNAKSASIVATSTASQASVTAVDAKSNALIANQTASEASITAVNAQSDALIAKQTASEASVTAVNAQSEANTVSVTASETKAALSNAQGDISALQVSASQASLDIANNSSAVASVTATAKGLQTTVANNSSAISGLKTTTSSQATQLSQTASQVALKADQTAVDTLKDTVTANSAAISVQADEIKQKVTSSDVQGLLNNGGYATQTWTSSQIDLTSNKFSLNLSALQTQVDNSAVGTNLLTGTTNYSSNWVWNVTPSIDNSQVPNILHYPKTTLSSGLSVIALQGINNGVLQPSTTYTASFYAKGTGTFIFYCFPSVGISYGDNHTVIKLTSNFQLYTITFTTVSNLSGNKSFLLRQDFSSIATDQNTVEAYVYGMKLEKGTVATDWCPNPADNATVTSVTSLEATVDGLQTTVSNKVNTTDYNSKMTQLSNLIDSKVSTADYNAEVTILANDIDLKVAKGDVVSQINQEAGGNTLIQVASGKGKLYLDAATTVFGGTAFISDAMITSLSADKISGGTIDGKLISANALNVALDNWSSNLQLAPNGLTITNGGITALQMDYSGLALFDPTTNTSVGKIHGAAYDNAKNPGLAFDLDTHGDFMAWTVQDDASEGYNSKLLWTRDDLASKLNIQYGFHVSDNITFHGNIYPEDATHADASHVHFQDITVNGARGFGIVNDLGCGIVICDNKTVWAVKQTNGTATQILG